MNFVRRLRPLTKEEHARFALIDTLRAVSDPTYRAAAAGMARDVRRGGAKAARLHVADLAGPISESGGAFIRLNPLCAAVADYAREGLDIDLAAIPNSDVRRRQAEDRLDRTRALSADRQHRAVRAAQQRQLLSNFDQMTRGGDQQ